MMSEQAHAANQVRNLWSSAVNDLALVEYASDELLATEGVLDIVTELAELTHELREVLG